MAILLQTKDELLHYCGYVTDSMFTIICVHGLKESPSYDTLSKWNKEKIECCFFRYKPIY